MERELGYIADMHDSALENDAAGDRVVVRRCRILLAEGFVGLCLDSVYSDQCAQMQQLTIEFGQSCPGRVTEFQRPAGYQLEHRLCIARRTRHHLQHVDGRGLLFDAFAVFAVAPSKFGGAFLQFAIRLGTADSDHRLLGEGPQQLHLRRGKIPWPVPPQGDGADRRTRTQNGTAIIERDITVVTAFVRNAGSAWVSGVHTASRARTARPIMESGIDRPREQGLVVSGPYRLHASVGLEMQQIAIEQRHGRAVGLTECRGPVRRSARKTGCAIARRSRHHFQHIDGRGLLFDTLAVLGVALCQFGSAGAELTKRPGACNGNHRLFGKGLHQSDLGVVEPPRIEPQQHNGADHPPPAQQRHAEQRPRSEITSELEEVGVGARIADVTDLAT